MYKYIDFSFFIRAQRNGGQRTRPKGPGPKGPGPKDQGPKGQAQRAKALRAGPQGPGPKGRGPKEPGPKRPGPKGRTPVVFLRPVIPEITKRDQMARCRIVKNQTNRIDPAPPKAPFVQILDNFGQPFWDPFFKLVLKLRKPQKQ